jgi:hypothetical protein
MLDAVREYHYRSLFRMSHEEFLNEPTESIDLLLQIDSVVQKVRNDE